jgi:CubicO group peptidase (beta-lactamase class C family)
MSEAEINEPGVEDFIRALERSPAVLRGLVLARRGKAVLRHFWGPYQEADPVWVYSLSKSFCSTAVGFAAQEGLLKTGDKVLSFFPEYEGFINDENCRAMTVQDLLTMRTGHETDTTMPVIQAENWAEAFLKLPVKFRPGTHFVYNSGATYMLSAIVQKLTGQKIHDYLGPRLFSPLGFGTTAWDSSPQGINTGGWGFMVTLEDIAKLGLLYLRRGNWQGKQLLSEKWCDEAALPHADNSITPGASADWSRGYGYQFWRSRYGYRGDGAFGQYCLIMPEFDAVLALSSETENMQEILDIVWEYLVPAFGTANEAEARISGREYRAEKNPWGIDSVSFIFSQSGLKLRFVSETGPSAEIEAGRYAWLESETRLPFGDFSFIPAMSMAGDGKKISASFIWRDKKNLALRLVYRNYPHREALSVCFEGDELRMSAQANPASRSMGRNKFELISHLR